MTRSTKAVVTCPLSPIAACAARNAAHVPARSRGHTRDGTITFPTIETFVETEVKGSPLENLLDEESYQGLMREAQERLQQFRAEGGEVIMPMDAFTITAEKS